MLLMQGVWAPSLAEAPRTHTLCGAAKTENNYTYLGVKLLGHDVCVFSTMSSSASAFPKYGCTNLHSNRLFEFPLLHSFSNVFVSSDFKISIHHE